MDTQTMDHLFAEQEGMLRSDPQRTAGLNVTFQFNLLGQDGGVWHLCIIDGEPSMLEGPAAAPDLVVTLTSEDYIAMARREIAGRDLFFTGRMQLEGNAMLGMLLGRIMG